MRTPDNRSTELPAECRTMTRAPLGLALLVATLASGCFGWNWPEGGGGEDAMAAMDAAADATSPDADGGRYDDGGSGLDAGQDAATSTDAGSSDASHPPDAGSADAGVDASYQPDAGGADAGVDASHQPDAGGTWEPCCEDGVPTRCFCPVGALCDPFGFVTCDDGTCMVGSGPCPSAS